MLTRPLHHLSADELDLALEHPTTPAVVAHLAACETCRQMVALDRLVVTALHQLPSLAPAPDFADRVMARVAAPVAPIPSARVRAARRRVQIGALVGAGGVALSLAWAALDPAGGVAWLTPETRQFAESLWPAWQDLSSQATTGTWSTRVSDLLGSPARVMVGATVAAALYTLALVGFRQLLTEPVPHGSR